MVLDHTFLSGFIVQSKWKRLVLYAILLYPSKGKSKGKYS